ncbi:hypothetical protein NX02_29565 [Sphingomonas sanxanigenens DSM 19645 = NX02]|uniref:Uncharacterized protein n=1 Tax=Sphingomonas sanxanigenens DSM 19645 = NX02 TaxID=1123269 RepID=W0AK38_9SPHN|nr:hypothetical protein NX02_29565 [Sphingomonas sanxanigenens DSM 19645 = NX02]
MTGLAALVAAGTKIPRRAGIEIIDQFGSTQVEFGLQRLETRPLKLDLRADTPIESNQIFLEYALCVLEE